MSYNHCEHREIREKVRTYLKNLRENSKKINKINPNMLKKVIFVEPRDGYFNKLYIKRLVVFLRGTGCSLAKETGGCTFCGFYNVTNFGVKVTDEDYISQITEVVNDKNINFQEYQVICLYNDGSLLREEEISFSALITMIKMLSEKSNVGKIVIESRVEDITKEKLFEMKAATNKELEIAVGFESADPLKRDLCINKNFDNEVFEKSCMVAKEYGISIVPLLIIKPPFLTEMEAINDYIESLKYLEKFNLNRIDMELPTVEKYTLVHDLWKNDMYSTLWFWSVIKILKMRQELKLKTPLYISPPNYSVSAEVKVSNCPKCDKLIYSAIDEFNRNGNVSVFDSIECTCKEEWKAQIKNEKWEVKLEQRVEQVLEKLCN